MGVVVSINIEPADKIILDTCLNEGGEVQQFFTNEYARYMDDYVPFDTGMLKNNKVLTPTYIDYVSPYAQRQYYENRGASGGNRGKHWDKRCWADHSSGIIAAVQAFVGG